MQELITILLFSVTTLVTLIIMIVDCRMYKKPEYYRVLYKAYTYLWAVSIAWLVVRLVLVLD